MLGCVYKTVSSLVLAREGQTKGQGQVMTNTLATIYSGVTAGYTSAFDGLVAIAVSILVISAGFALVKGMVPHRVRIK